MAHAASLEERLDTPVVIDAHQRLIKWLHLDQILSRIKLRPWHVLQSSYDFLWDVYEEGKGYLWTGLRPIFKGDHAHWNWYFSRALGQYKDNIKYKGPLNFSSEAAVDSVAERQINNGDNSFGRKLAYKIGLSAMAEEEANIQQHNIPLQDSFWFLPINLPKYIWNKITGKKTDEVLELGHLFRLSYSGLALTLDQNLLYQISTLGLGKRYEIYEEGKPDNVLATITRRPFRKLISFGLLNHYELKIYSKALAAKDSFKAIMTHATTVIQDMFWNRVKMPDYEKAPTPEELMRHE